MNITFVMLGLRDHSTGGYAFNFRMVKALEEAGHSVSPVHWGTVPPGVRGSRLRGSLHVLGHVLKHPPDLLIISKSYSFMFPLRMLLYLRRLPVLYMVHHLEWHDRDQSGSGARRRIVRWFLGAGDRIWVNSGSTAGDVASLGIPTGRMTVVPPGYTPFPVTPYRLRETPVQILSVGTICPRKDQLTLVEGCAALEDLDFQLHILGDESADPGYAARVRELAASSGISGRVFFHGHLTLEELRGFYRTGHILANLSRWEGYGMAVAEALQSGMPVVAAGAGAVPEIVEDGVEGFLVPPGDAAMCSLRLRELITGAPLRERMSENCLKRAESLYTWADTAREFTKLAETAASHHKENGFG